ncbi:hypothetical protein L1987_56048 [Smallanthus sonchifolius]|uniref:Uncharacterized protein n=1 Tax=Smallanthus sonchifolius TaxID=185202 RepID=A0ACB9EBC4_9ASTR|nr:hypothetical protein L1987_56048 [Smallanthus sonchifolius]
MAKFPFFIGSRVLDPSLDVIDHSLWRPIVAFTASNSLELCMLELVIVMASRANIRLITYSNELVNGETVYISSNCLPIKASHFEPAGHSFHDVALKLRGYFEEENVPDDNESFPKDKETDQDAEKVESVCSNSNKDVWSAVQETTLVQALKTFPKETNQRWERVAAAVPGKTVNQCKKQFALLKKKFKNKKK